MHNHRVWIAGTFVWLFTMFNIERICEPINLASFVYALATLGGVAMLVIRGLRELPLRWTAPACLLVFVVTKCALGYSVSLQTLPLTLIEAIAISGTLFLANRIGRHTDAFTATTAELMQTMQVRSVPELSDLEPAMQREMRRARRYERPLTVVTVRPQDPQSGPALEALVAQLEADLVNRYAQGRLAELLLGETKSNDLVAWDGSRFVVMLPETTREQAGQMLARVSRRIESMSDFRVETGMADFPSDEITWSGLLETAANSSTSPQILDELAADLSAAETELTTV